MKKQSLACVLLSDVVASRKIKDRKKFEKVLNDALEEAAKRFSDVFDLPLKVWKGLDETAAVVSKPWLLYEVIDLISRRIAPQKMRFVVVKGKVDVWPKDGDVARADGEAFHKAAALMLDLKKEGLPFTCSTGNEEKDKAWKMGLNLLLLVKKPWTVQQLKVFEKYKETGAQEEVAKDLKITQQAISKTLKSIGAVQVVMLEKEFTDWAATALK